MPEILPRAHDKKVCNDCGELKSFSEFYKHSTLKGGIHVQCKICINEVLLIRRRNKNLAKAQFDSRPLGKALSEEESKDLKSRNKAYIIYTSDIVQSIWPFSYLDFSIAIPTREAKDKNMDNYEENIYMDRFYIRKETIKISNIIKIHAKKLPKKLLSEEEKLEIQTKYYSNNRDKILIRIKKYYWKNREAILIKKREYHLKNRDRILEKQKIRYKNKKLEAK